MTKQPNSAVLLVAAALVCGCGRYGFAVAGQPDAGISDDTGTPRDTGTTADVGTDGGPTDADSGMTPDAGPPDLGSPDLGSPTTVGCHDGQREGFLDGLTYPAIAGCAGAFDQPGVLSTTIPACGGSGDDDPTNAAGVGCNVADLCAAGWHVCDSPADIVASGATDCDDAASAPNLFFVVRVTGGGNGSCFVGPTNDVFGCGTLGDPNVQPACGPINRYLNDGCAADPTSTWVCPAGAGEADLVVHTDVTTGGALCCRD